MKKRARRVSSMRRSSVGARGTDDKSFLIIAAGGFLLILIALFFFSGSKSRQSEHMASENSMMGKEVIFIKDYAFSPSNMTIKTGDSIVWRNQDPVEQAVVAKDGSFKTETMFQGGFQSVTFSKAGTYTYYSTKFPSMQGIITVE